MNEAFQNLSFTLVEGNRTKDVVLPVRRMIIAGWTGRHADAMEAHIKELEKLGVTRPERTPMFYRVAASLLTNAEAIEVSGSASSGEVEFFVTRIDGDFWVGVASDHTDRKAEVYGVALSKQMCGKPVGKKLWRLNDVKDHWDQLQLRSYAINNKDKRLYQEGTVAAMLPIEQLLEMFRSEDDQGGIGSGDFMMCGTLPAIGGVRGADTFLVEMIDPVLDRRMAHEYGIKVLPVAG